MSLSRFLQNLIGSVRRTQLRIPPDPFAAEKQFCGARNGPTAPIPAPIVRSRPHTHVCTPSAACAGLTAGHASLSSPIHR
jgi:hypothetical protein